MFLLDTDVLSAHRRPDRAEPSRAEPVVRLDGSALGF